MKSPWKACRVPLIVGSISETITGTVTRAVGLVIVVIGRSTEATGVGPWGFAVDDSTTPAPRAEHRRHRTVQRTGTKLLW